VDLAEPPEYPQGGAEMLTSARFAHSHPYILSLASTYAYEVVEVRDIIVRTEVSVPLPGKIYMLCKR
jgi:predicted TPR repeat methyltransferase